MPFPVNRKEMDESIQILEQSIQAARIGDKEKMQSLQRLRRFVPTTSNSQPQVTAQNHCAISVFKLLSEFVQ